MTTFYIAFYESYLSTLDTKNSKRKQTFAFWKSKTNVLFVRFNETLGYSWFGWVVQGVAQGGKKVTNAAIDE